MSKYLHILLPAAALSQASWRELSAENTSTTSAPAPRLGGILAAAGPGAGYALHGGCSSSCCYAPLSDLWLLTAAAQWVNVSAQLNAPTGRLYHGASPAAAPGASYVYGGTDVQTGTLDELYLLTVDAGAAPSAAWAPVRAPLPHPAPRSGHSQTALGAGAPAGSFLVLGGQDDDEGVLGDAWRFAPTPGAPEEGAWSLVANFSASGPGPRVQHSALALTLPWGAPALLLAAGTDAQGDDQDDVWLLDLGAAAPAAQWLLLGARPAAAPPAAWPSARHGHVAWGQQAAPAGPTGSAATLSFYLFGGQDGPVPDPPKFLSDTWLFTVNVTQGGSGGVALWGGQGAFSPVRPAAAPSARALAGVAATASATVLAGGFAGYNGGTDDRLLNDVWQVEGGR